MSGYQLAGLYFRIPKRQQFEWLDSFRKHNNFFTDEANFYVDESLGSEDNIIERSDDFIEIGLYRRITLEEELKACLEELKACLDGRSSRTAREIKQRMFNCFFTVNGEMFGAGYVDPDYHPFEFQFESILNEFLNEFLTCIKNHKSC